MTAGKSWIPPALLRRMTSTLKPQQYDHPEYDASIEVLIRLPREPLSIEARRLLVDLHLDPHRLTQLLSWLRKREFMVKSWRDYRGERRLMILRHGWLEVTVACNEYWRKVYDETPSHIGIAQDA